MQQNLREMQIIGEGTRERLTAAPAASVLRSRRIMLAGVTEAAPEFSFVRQRPALGFVLACFAGEGSVLIRNEWHSCPAGTGYIAPPHIPHAYHALPGGGWGTVWVMYDTPSDAFGRTDGRTTPEKTTVESTPFLVRLDPEPLRAAVLGLYRESIGPAESVVMSHWAELVHLHASRIIKREHQDDRLRRVWERVDADLAHNWTLGELARSAYLSGEHLRLLCQKGLSRSPMQQVTYLRMNRAAALLQTTSQSVESIARMVGYSNPYAFSTAFKRWMGKAPLHYRSRT